MIRWSWIFAEAALLGVLWKRGLLGRYRWFAAFLAVEWLQMLTLIELSDGSPLYSACWALSEIALLLALSGAAFELTRKLLTHYAEIPDFASSSFGMSFWFALVAAAVIGVPLLPSSAWQSLDTYVVMKALFWESWTLFFFLLAQVVWLKLFPVRMSRNLLLHRWLLALYGGAIPGVWILLMELIDKSQLIKEQVNLAMMLCEIALLSVWCCWFNAAGEQIQTRPGLLRRRLLSRAH